MCDECEKLRAGNWDSTPSCLFCRAKTKVMHVTHEGAVCENCNAPRESESDDVRLERAAFARKAAELCEQYDERFPGPYEKAIPGNLHPFILFQEAIEALAQSDLPALDEHDRETRAKEEIHTLEYIINSCGETGIAKYELTRLRDHLVSNLKGGSR